MKVAEQPEFLTHALGIDPDPFVEGVIVEPQVRGHAAGRGAVEADAVVGQAEAHELGAGQQWLRLKLLQ